LRARTAAWVGGPLYNEKGAEKWTDDESCKGQDGRTNHRNRSVPAFTWLPGRKLVGTECLARVERVNARVEEVARRRSAATPNAADKLREALPPQILH
jgi:hypothetical protein